MKPIVVLLCAAVLDAPPNVEVIETTGEVVS